MAETERGSIDFIINLVHRYFKNWTTCYMKTMQVLGHYSVGYITFASNGQENPSRIGQRVQICRLIKRVGVIIATSKCTVKMFFLKSTHL